MSYPLFEGTVANVFLSGKFDSGNLQSVAEDRVFYTSSVNINKFDAIEYDFLRKADRHLLLRTRNDAQGQEKESGNRSWFHFAICNTSPNELHVTLHMANLNKHNKLYQQGMRPVIRCSGPVYKPNADVCPSNFIEKGWRRLKSHTLAYGNTEYNGFSVSFAVKLPPDQYYYIAFCYPFSYASSLRLIDLVKQTVRASNLKTKSEDRIYLEDTVLCKTVENRKIYMLTISQDGDSARPKPKSPVDSIGARTTSSIDSSSLTPLPDSLGGSPAVSTNFARSLFSSIYLDEQGVVLSPFQEKFPIKKCLIVTARVHPGETPGQLTFSGFLRFVLSNDVRARILRQHFVIRAIPMLNPDGVYRGHYRCDVYGNNLNRYYLAPDPKKQPQCHALKELMGWICDSRENPAENVFFLDMHAHAAKRGCFLFGNSLLDHSRQIGNVLYAKIAEQNSLYFDFDACNFTQKNMQVVDKRDGMGREGCSRVAFHKLFNLQHCYTLESNYNAGRWPARKLQSLPHRFLRENGNVMPWLARLQDEKAKNVSPSGIYTDELCWLEVGAALMVSVLDLFKLLPSTTSRIGCYNRVYEMTEKTLPSYVRPANLLKTRSDTSLKMAKSSGSNSSVNSTVPRSPHVKQKFRKPHPSLGRVDVPHASSASSRSRVTDSPSHRRRKADKPPPKVVETRATAHRKAAIVQGYFERSRPKWDECTSNVLFDVGTSASDRYMTEPLQRVSNRSVVNLDRMQTGLTISAPIPLNLKFKQLKQPAVIPNVLAKPPTGATKKRSSVRIRSGRGDYGGPVTGSSQAASAKALTSLAKPQILAAERRNKVQRQAYSVMQAEGGIGAQWR